MGPDRSLENVEEVGPDGTVRRVIPRWQMRKENLLHRSVYIAVVCVDDSQDCLVVHRRAATKDINPGLWDIGFGGVCDVGEHADQAARRELKEEAGIDGVELIEVGTGLYIDQQNSVLGTVYVATYQGEFTFADGEVTASKNVPFAQIEDWISSTPVCPDSVSLVLPQVAPYIDFGAK